jgi:diaminopimelate decarboxylase
VTALAQQSGLAIEAGPTVAGHDPEALLAEHGSPLYVYDLDVIRRRVAALRVALPERTEIAFAVKANPSPAVLETLRRVGVGADVASGGELAAVLRAGFEPATVCFTGPGKTDRELEAALRARIRALTIESLDELDAVLGMASLAHPGQGLLLRLAVEAGTEERPIIGAAGSAKFGLADGEADEALDRLRGAAALGPGGPYRVLGFHAFGASNVLDAGVLVDAFRELADRAEALAGDHGLDVRLIDAGGGLGIPYRAEAPELDLQALGAGVSAELATWADRPSLRGARVLLEPGRWLVGPAGAYLTRVVRNKVRGGRTIAVMDGGIHHLARPVLAGEQQRVVAVGPAAARAAEGLAATDIVGPLCTGLDVLASGVELPRSQAGDVYAILDSGAYGFTESMPFFLSHPIPAEIGIDGPSITLSRPRWEPDSTIDVAAPGPLRPDRAGP